MPSDDARSWQNAESAPAKKEGKKPETGSDLVEFLDKKPNVDFKESKIYKAADYRYSKVQVTADGDDLYARFSGVREKARFLRIRNYRQTTAADILRYLTEKGIDQGRHFGDAIHDFYHENGLHLGYVVPILKPFTAGTHQNMDEMATEGETESVQKQRAETKMKPTEETSEPAVERVQEEQTGAKADLHGQLRGVIEGDGNSQSKGKALERIARENGMEVKEVQEETEAVIADMMREIDGESIPDTEKFAKLTELYQQQPVLSKRTSTSMRNQAYSTPVPLAWA